MSCYEWERGTIVIPSKTWAKAKATLVEAWNRGVQSDLAIAERLFADLKAKQKGKRGVDWGAAVRDEVLRYAATGHYGASRPVYAFSVLPEHKVVELLVGPDKKLRRVKKKDLPFATRKTTYFAADDGCISIDNNTRSLCWGVSENNHACEHARDSYMGKAFFALLRSITFTRGSGGVIVGNNEYNQSDDSPGGGGNRINDAFGPIGEEAKAQSARRSGLRH